jgi:hypothetical protein
MKMAIDFDAIRKKLNKLSGQGGRRDSLWRPTEGEDVTIRLLSFPDNDGQPFKERYFYYNIGSNPGLLAPYQFGKPDPFQELINHLRGDDNKSSYELAKKLYPKMRVYAPVIVRGEEGKGVRLWSFGKMGKGVRLWSFGKMVYQSLLGLMLDEEYGDITDPDKGCDLKVSCVKPPGKQWATTTVQPRRRSSVLSEDPSEIKEWMSNIPDLDDLYTMKSYEELEKIINDWLDGGASADSTGTSRGYSQSTQSSSSSDDDTDEDSGSTGASFEDKMKSLDKAFSELGGL